MQFKKKIIAGALAAGLVMGAGGIAAAYFTATGTGNGSGSVGSSTPWAVVVANTASATLTPGGPGETIDFTVTNPSTGHQYLQKVTISITTFSDQSNTGLPACTQTTFYLTGSTAQSQSRAVTTNEASGATYSGSVVLYLKTNGGNQDNCEGVTVPIHVSATSA